MSANRFGPPPTRGGSPSFLPITADILDLKEAIARAQSSGDKEAIVGVLLHPYDFIESGDERGRLTLEDMEASLRWLSAQDGVEVSSLSAMLGQSRDLSSSRFAANHPPVVDDARPPCIAHVGEIPYYMGTARARRSKQRRIVGILATHLGGTALGASTGWAIHEVAPPAHAFASVVLWAVPCLLILTIIWRARALGGLYFRSALLLAFALGWVVIQIYVALIGAGDISI
jgi:hypothetical protein